jgi:RNA polymerase sigma-70 factor (ECF subfamily)
LYTGKRRHESPHCEITLLIGFGGPIVLACKINGSIGFVASSSKRLLFSKDFAARYVLAGSDRSNDSASLDAPSEDPILIKRASEGDPEAFAALFNRYYAMVHAFAYRLCFDQAEAHDIAQEAFIRAARSLGSFANFGKAGSFRSWLYRIALNAARDSLRQRRRRKALDEEILFRHTRQERARTGPFCEIELALAALPEDLRRALVLVFYEEMSHAQAAAVLGCAEATVSWRVFRAKRQLRKKLIRFSRQPHHET